MGIKNILSALGLLVFLKIFWSIGKILLPRREYYILNDRIVKKQGIFNRNVTEVEFSNVQVIHGEKSFFSTGSRI